MLQAAFVVVLLMIMGVIITNGIHVMSKYTCFPEIPHESLYIAQLCILPVDWIRTPASINPACKIVCMNVECAGTCLKPA